MSETSLTPAGESAAAPAPAQPGLLERWRSLVAYQGLSLGVLCALVTVSLLLSNELTHEQFAVQQQEDQLADARGGFWRSWAEIHETGGCGRRRME